MIKLASKKRAELNPRAVMIKLTGTRSGSASFRGGRIPLWLMTRAQRHQIGLHLFPLVPAGAASKHLG
jgi:hypothetical protein